MSNYGVYLSGCRFGRLVAVQPMKNKHGNRVWQCRCDCGTECTPSTNALTSGRATSCGCLTRESTIARNTTHGMSGTPEHRAWKAIQKRCYNTASPDYPDYGGRGIKVCERWRGPNGFTAFLADMGQRPHGMSIDRKDNDGNYCPENCRWATPKQQARNKRTSVLLTHEGITMNQEDWAQSLGLTPSALVRRRSLNQSLKQILSPKT